MSQYAISLADVEDAHETIRSYVHVTPVMTSASVNKLAGDKEVFFKVEGFQKAGSFKSRGATNAIMKLPSDVQKKGVVTHSSGNHGQAVALAARARNIPAYICMPHTAPQVKIDAVRSYGASITFCEPTDESRVKSAEEVQRETGAYFVHPSNEPNVMAGQGTIALELFDQIHCHPQDSDPFDAVIVPIGGGGLISGITTTLRAINPRIKVIGAEPANADDAYRSKRDNELRGHEKPPQTIADGLKTTLGSNTWPIVRDLVDEIIPVSEEQICYATQLVWERMKICIEPSSGTGLAALLDDKIKYREDLKRIVVILCGANVDLSKPLPWMK